MQNPWVIRAYPELSTYLASFRHYSRSIHAYSGPYLSEQIMTHLELMVTQARNTSRIFRHIHKVKHIETYLPTLRFSHIQDPGITSSNNVKQHLLFKSDSSFKSLFRSAWKFFHFCFKSKHSTFFSSGQYFNNNNDNNNSSSLTLACHPRQPSQHATHSTHNTRLSRHPRQYATHATHARTSPTQARDLCYPHKHATHASTNSTPFLKLEKLCLQESIINFNFRSQKFVKIILQSVSEKIQFAPDQVDINVTYKNPKQTFNLQP